MKFVAAAVIFAAIWTAHVLASCLQMAPRRCVQLEVLSTVKKLGSRCEIKVLDLKDKTSKPFSILIPIQTENCPKNGLKLVGDLEHICRDTHPMRHAAGFKYVPASEPCIPDKKTD